ncbi:alpha/beta-hydrolase [Piedraia hortae CBS 480.64]|uniref:Alpha/beta-hydrolase n=1 Tax=Piedraia hortae CBS 480.64 TaxID=1314780 RepID=A0A6A7BWD3_9PEZI|nr:alpha/beta-hydrolase [Piedraia hortae CBS 480.64]
MAAPGGKFFVQDNLAVKALHHESFEQLWKVKWQALCRMGVYPFMFAKYEDFVPIADQLIKEGFKEPYKWNEYAQVFFPKAEELVQEANKAEKAGEKEKASEFYLRASAVYRISRFPIPRSEKQRYAWEQGKKAALKGLELKERPTREVTILHKHGLEHEGKEIKFFYHLPPEASKEKPVPLVIIFTGLDGYRTELAVWVQVWTAKQVAVVILEVPGTGDSPADPKDVKSPDREWSSLFDWIGQQTEINQRSIALWGFSTGGYYAIRIAHTHHDRLAGVAALGGGCHYMFAPDWLDQVNHLEYPFDLANALAHKWGYGNDVETFKKEAMKNFSLVEDKTLDSPDCTRLLLVNGENDEIFPIDDYYECLFHGKPKEVRFVHGRKHMGEPESFSIVIKWIYDLFGLEGEPKDVLKLLPFKAKF